MNIRIETIPHGQQRYPTVGDWFFDSHGDLVIKVSELGDWRYEALVAVHELVEVLLCKHQGVSQEEVDKFDIEFEKARVEGNVDEPGDDVRAPYRRQHCLATAIERVMAAEFGVAWNDYNDAIQKLP